MSMKKNIVLALAALPLLFSCGGEEASSSSFTPENEVQEIFAKIKENNFTVDWTVKGYEGNRENRKFFYTSYAYQEGEGEGSHGVAQDEEGIYSYTIESGDSIESTAPLVSSSNGTRYEGIYDYSSGAEGFDLASLPSEKGEDGYYAYEYDSEKHYVNDALFNSLFLRWSPLSPINPREVKFRIVNSSLLIHAVLHVYDGDGEENVLTLEADTTVYDIGLTELSEIKSYQDSGQGAKAPIDLRFYAVMGSYFSCNDNYSLDIDGTHVTSVTPFSLKEKCLPEGYLTENAGYRYGAVVAQGYVNQFDIVNGKLVIRDTPQQDESTFYESVFGELRTSFSSLDFSLLSGYQSDSSPDTYIITDSQFISYFSSIIHVTLSDEMTADSISFTILDEEKKAMEARLDFHEADTQASLGYLKATFYDPGTTSIPEIEEYLSLGKDPFSQDKEELGRMLEKFKGHNYSMDTMTSIGMAKTYYHEDYFYQVPYSPTYKNTNTGFLKDGDSIYSFSVLYELDESNSYVPSSISVSTRTDYAYEYGTTLPGVGTMFGDSYYVDYTSTFEEIYDLDAYEAGTLYGQASWMSSDNSFAISFFNYLYGSSSGLLPQGFGILCDEEANKLSLLSYASTSSMSSYGYTNLTYYDIGTTKNEEVEALIAEWKASRA